MGNRRNFLKTVFSGALLASVPAVATHNPVIDTKVSVFGEQPDDPEGAIVIHNIHADGSYSVQKELYMGDYVH